MKNIKDITKEEYDEMNSNPSLSYDSFILFSPEVLLYSESEIEWLKAHDFDISFINKIDEVVVRLFQEQYDLEEKLNKLNTFNESEGIDPAQQSLLLVQAGAMYTYNECLKARIKNLTTTKNKSI